MKEHRLLKKHSRKLSRTDIAAITTRTIRERYGKKKAATPTVWLTRIYLIAFAVFGKHGYNGCASSILWLIVLIVLLAD